MASDKRNRLPIDTGPKLRAYLQDLVDLDEGYGTTITAVALRLIWDGVRRAIELEHIQRRPPTREKKS